MADPNNGPLKTIVDGLKSLSELEVTTVVGNVVFDVENVDNKPTIQLRETKVDGDTTLQGCFTRIDLVAGDIQNLVDHSFLEEKKELLDFHRQQVDTGREIVRTNVEMLIRLGKQAAGKLAPLLGMQE